MASGSLPRASRSARSSAVKTCSATDGLPSRVSCARSDSACGRVTRGMVESSARKLSTPSLVSAIVADTLRNASRADGATRPEACAAASTSSLRSRCTAASCASKASARALAEARACCVTASSVRRAPISSALGLAA